MYAIGQEESETNISETTPTQGMTAQIAQHSTAAVSAFASRLRLAGNRFFLFSNFSNFMFFFIYQQQTTDQKNLANCKAFFSWRRPKFYVPPSDYQNTRLMKLLENTVFDSVSSYIITNASYYTLDFRLESYSCKMISTDKKEWKKSMKCSDGSTRKRTNSNEISPTSPTTEDVFMPLSESPNFNNINMHGNGRLRHLSEPSGSGSDTEENGGCLMLMGVVPRRTLFDIVALLNLSYIDYDFTQTKSASFSIVNYQECVQKVDEQLSAAVTGYAKVRDDIWKVIDDEIKVADCVIYSYMPSYTSDPFTEAGCIWSFNYLFHNKLLKRFVFFACRALCSDDSGAAEEMWNDETSLTEGAFFED